MTRLLFVVEETFFLSEHGLILMPGLGGDARCVIGTKLQLKRPNGNVLETEIAGIEMGGPIQKLTLPILVKGLTKDDVPVGREVRSVDA